jgi:signal recognition particle subunit SRP54
LFDTLSDKLQAALGDLRGRGRLDEESVSRAMREIRLALLEADVNFKVVKDFTAQVRARALGADVLKSITPGQQVVKIVHEELTALMGPGASKLAIAGRPPTVVLLAGLQGSGKTTAAAKLAVLMRKEGHSQALVAADLQRPAAIEQLEQLGRQIQIPVYTGNGDSVAVSAKGIEQAKSEGRDLVIIDTAGRHQIDEELMDELAAVRAAVKPTNVLLVLDAMTGQEAVAVAEAFLARVEFDGMLMTKLDGDARGGAALSITAATGRPVFFAGTGERPADLEPFHPDRMASRILGMGDMLTLIDKAQETLDAERAMEAAEKMARAQFTLEDFLVQMREMRKLGPLQDLLAMLPGVPGGKNALKDLAGQVDERQLARAEAVICSMTPEERRNPAIIGGSRRLRIARGSGAATADVNVLLKEFQAARKMMQSMMGGKRMPRIPGMPKMPGMG